MWVDTHCHLDAAEFAADRDAVAARARQAGVATLVVPAVEVANFAAVRDCCARYAGCRPAYGIHPIYLDRVGAGDLDALRAWLAAERDGPLPPVAVGEIGLDFFVPGLDPARQTALLDAQLAIARDAGLPVILHVRRAVDAIIAALRRTRVGGGIAHAFNGSRQQADALIGLGFKLGFGGAMTHDRATRLRELAATLPLDAIVVETDAPDIPPAFIGRGRNEPAFLPRIAETLADLRGLMPAEVAAATTAAARAALPGIC